MKFRQIRKDLFQMGDTHWAIHREDTSRWRLGVIDKDFFYPGHGCLYFSRKYAGEQVLKKFTKYTEVQMQEVFFKNPAMALRERFGEPQKRKAPPPSFRTLLKGL